MILTEEGYYWVRENTVQGSEYEIVRVRKESYKPDFEVYATGWECEMSVSDFTDWVGPLEPPSDTNKERKTEIKDEIYDRN